MLPTQGPGTSSQDSLYRSFWSDSPGDNGAATRIHLMGKDILRFHAVYWPAFLMSAGLPLPTTVWAHGWWLRDSKKMSKSVGNVVRPDDLVARFGPDALRYYLLREMVFGQDASFSDEAFVDRFNSDLANDLGNTASRVVRVTRGAFDGRTPPLSCDDNPLIPVARQVVADYRAAMDELAFQDALRALWRLLAETNQYLVVREPWKMIKEEGATDALSRILWNGLEAVRIVATGLLPFMPTVARQVLAAVGTSTVMENFDAMAWGGTPTSAPLPELAPLFPRIDKEKFMSEIKSTASEATPPAPAATPAAPTAPAAPASAATSAAAAMAPPVTAAAQATTEIAIDQFFATELKVGTVKFAERVPKSDKLIRLLVDLGEEAPRQLVAGIGKAYAPEDLVGNQVVVVANLKPAKLMGVESRGMILGCDRRRRQADPGSSARRGGAERNTSEVSPVPFLVDSHCHLQYLEPEARAAAIARARDRGVNGFLAPATLLSQAARSSSPSAIRRRTPGARSGCIRTKPRPGKPVTK